MVCELESRRMWVAPRNPATTPFEEVDVSDVVEPARVRAADVAGGAARGRGGARRLIPVATLEDHGPHLPIDTDLRITAEICRRAAEAAPDEIVLLPPIPHGYSPHHMDFPGPITIGWDTFTRYCVDVGSSLARHGFTRMLYLNGHGSNQNLVETAARLVGARAPRGARGGAPSTSRAEGSARVVDEVRDSERGGMGHACELETSIYLAIDPEAVDMDKAVDERATRRAKHAYDGLVATGR